MTEKYSEGVVSKLLLDNNNTFSFNQFNKKKRYKIFKKDRKKEQFRNGTTKPKVS